MARIVASHRSVGRSVSSWKKGEGDGGRCAGSSREEGKTKRKEGGKGKPQRTFVEGEERRKGKKTREDGDDGAMTKTKGRKRKGGR